MTYRPAVQLEREFFQAFFALLREHEVDQIEWRSHETVARFREVSRFLLEHADDHDDVSRLANRLRPDPISGLVPALDANIGALQPGLISLPNSRYKYLSIADASIFKEAGRERCLRRSGSSYQER